MFSSGEAQIIEPVNVNGNTDFGMPHAFSGAGLAAGGSAKYISSITQAFALASSQIPSQPRYAWLVARMQGVAVQVLPRELNIPNLRCDCDEDTLQYANRKGLTGYLMTFIEIAADCFRHVRSPSCRLVQDPEADHQYIVLDLKVKDDGEILESEDRFNMEVIRAMPNADLYLLSHTLDIE